MADFSPHADYATTPYLIESSDLIKTAKLTKPSQKGYSLLIIKKSKNFTIWLYVMPKDSSGKAMLQVVAEVKPALMRNSEECWILVHTEIQDRNSGQRLDDPNCCPRPNKICEGFSSRGIQDLVSCESLDGYRNTSVKLVTKVKLSFKFSERDDFCLLYTSPSPRDS